MSYDPSKPTSYDNCEMTLSIGRGSMQLVLTNDENMPPLECGLTLIQAGLCILTADTNLPEDVRLGVLYETLRAVQERIDTLHASPGPDLSISFINELESSRKGPKLLDDIEPKHKS